MVLHKFLKPKMVQRVEALDHLWSRAQDPRGSTKGVVRVAGGNSAWSAYGFGYAIRAYNILLSGTTGSKSYKIHDT